MKTFFLSAAVFLLLVGVLIASGWYIDSRSMALEEAAKALPKIAKGDLTEKTEVESAENGTLFRSKTDAFATLWKETKTVIHAIVGHEKADRIEETFLDLRIRYAMQDEAGYMSAREKLIREIRQLSEQEDFTFDAIS